MFKSETHLATKDSSYRDKEHTNDNLENDQSETKSEGGHPGTDEHL